MENIDPHEKLLEMPVPVIMVIGQGQNCNKLDIQVALRNKFLSQGYKVAQAGSSKSADFDQVPLYEANPLWQKTLLYNKHFRKIAVEEKPDILIVGVPGGIMPLDSRHHEYFGETALAISKALQPDISILSLYYTTDYTDSIADVTNYVNYALEAPLDYLHISNNMIIFEPDMRNISFLETENTRTYDGNTFNVFDESSTNGVFDSIIGQLQDNIEML